LGPVELLLGLLDEPECRAATMLAARAIGPSDVLARWPEVAATEADVARSRDYSPQLAAAIASATGRTSHYPRPLVLATEHLLLGLATTDDEVARWLVERGVDPWQLEEEVHRLNGQSCEPVQPIDLPAVDEPPSSPTSTAPTRSQSVEPSRTAPPGATSAHEQVRVLRILDASANRAREGLRVVEDFVRFACDDASLMAITKSLRHDLAGLLARLDPQSLLAARETQADVGTSVSTPAELVRASLDDVATASLKRVEEALRSLEEYGKTLDPVLAQGLEQLRYRVYTLERAIGIGTASRLRLAECRLYVLIDGREDAGRFEALAASLVAAGVGALQLRDKTLSDRVLLERAKLLRQVTRGSPTLCIINDRPDLAALAEADGLHLGQDELTVKDARTVVGSEMLIGVSTHSVEEARQAVQDGASYLGVGPTFPSTTKQFATFTGLELLEAVAGATRLPAFAIGGIDRTNLDRVLATGIGRVAVAGAVCGAADPAAAARELLGRLASR